MIIQGLLIILVILSVVIVPRNVEAKQVLIPLSQEEYVCPKPEESLLCSGNAEACTKGVSMTLASPTPTPTETPTPTATFTPTPTSLPSHTSESQNKEAESTDPEKPTSLNIDTIFEMINNHRKEIGKEPYQKEDKLCALAQERGPELYDEIFVNGNIHGGLYDRNLPYWITENMKYGDNEEAVFNWWMGSSIHRKAIEGDFHYSCGVCYGNSCAQLFTSYVPK